MSFEGLQCEDTHQTVLVSYRSKTEPHSYYHQHFSFQIHHLLLLVARSRLQSIISFVVSRLCSMRMNLVGNKILGTCAYQI